MALGSAVLSVRESLPGDRRDARAFQDPYPRVFTRALAESRDERAVLADRSGVSRGVRELDRRRTVMRKDDEAARAGGGTALRQRQVPPRQDLHGGRMKPFSGQALRGLPARFEKEDMGAAVGQRQRTEAAGRTRSDDGDVHNRARLTFHRYHCSSAREKNETGPIISSKAGPTACGTSSPR